MCVGFRGLNYGELHCSGSMVKAAPKTANNVQAMS